MTEDSSQKKGHLHSDREEIQRPQYMNNREWQQHTHTGGMPAGSPVVGFAPARTDIPPARSSSSRVHGQQNRLGALLGRTPVTRLAAIVGFGRAFAAANPWVSALAPLRLLVTSLPTAMLPPPFALAAIPGPLSTDDATTVALHVATIAALLFTTGSAAERRWGSGRFFAFLLFAHAAGLVAALIAALLTPPHLRWALGVGAWVPAVVALLVQAATEGGTKSRLLLLFLTYALVFPPVTVSSTAGRRPMGSGRGGSAFVEGLLGALPYIVAGLLVRTLALPTERFCAPFAPPPSAPSNPVGYLRYCFQSVLFGPVSTALRRVLDALLGGGGSASRSSPQQQQQQQQQQPSAAGQYRTRIIGRIEEIGYHRSGTQLTDEEEMLYLAELQGLRIPRPAGAGAGRGIPGIGPGIHGGFPAGAPQTPVQQMPEPREYDDPFPGAAATERAAAAAAPNRGPMTPEQGEKVNTLLALGFDGLDAEKARGILEAAGWQIDTAASLILEGHHN